MTEGAAPEEEPEKREPPAALRLARAPVEAVGRPISFVIGEIGELTMFFGQFLYWLPRRPFRWSELVRHMRDIGFGSLFIVVLTGFFTGLAFSFQSLQGFGRFGAEALVGPTTLLGLARELGPVLTGLVVAGRSGSGMATELGTMRVTEQIDAMSTMAVSPIQYLVVPRVIVATLMMPMLVSVFTGCGFIGSVLRVVYMDDAGVDPGVFFYETWRALDPPDYWEGYVKGMFFGAQIALISCFKGFNAAGGARGVGVAATAAVVISSVSILVGTYFLGEILNPLLYGYIYFDALP